MLRIIIGRTGSGKSEKCITEFNAYIQKNRSVDTASYLFVPEQYNMLTERRLLDFQVCENFPVKGLMGHEVLNFKRFVHRILSIYGLSKTKQLTECGKIMLLTAAVSNKANDMLFYKSLRDKNGEITKVLSLIDEFGKYGITHSQLSNINTDDMYLNRKLHDIALLYEEYESLKKDKYSDENDSFENMLTHVEKNNFFKNKSVWIDSFTGFTAQENKLIKLMLRQCKSVTITLCTDYSGEPAFACIDRTLESLKGLAAENSIETEIINLSADRASNKQKYNNLSIFNLEQNISCNRITKSYDYSNIFLAECEGVFDEVIHCAEQIKFLHNEKNIEYGKIAVALRDIKGYDVIIKAIFKKYDIPYFIDDKKPIDNNPLIKAILSVLSVIVDNWQPDDVIECIKSDLFEFSEISDITENYILSRGLRGKNAYKNSENKMCQKIYFLITELCDEFAKCENFKQACKVLCLFLEKNGVKKRLEYIVKETEQKNDFELTNEYSRIWNILLEVIQQIALFLGEEKCSDKIKTAEMLRRLLSAGFAQFKIGFLPARLDSVQIMNIERSRSAENKVLFLIGANEGVIPANFNDNGMLKDAEREELNRLNIILADDSETKVSKENYFVYTTLSLPSDYLYISWTTEDLDGKSTKASHIILRKIKKLFKDIEVKQYKYKPDFYSSPDDSKINNQIKVSTEINSKLFGLDGTFTTSVSQIETYYKCPFSYLVTYGLKVRPRDEAKLKQTDFGSVVHEIAEEISGELFSIPTDSPTEAYELLVENAYNKIKENFRFTKYELSEQDANVLKRVKKYAAKSFRNIRRQVDAGTFKVKGYEVPFNSRGESELKTYSIVPENTTEQLKLINIEGRIDRYDLMEDETGHKYVRVVDYKTSTSSAGITEYDIKAGVTLQLITYLNVVVNSFTENAMTPAGALYYVFDSDIKTVSEHFTVVPESQKIKSYNMTGYVLDDDNVLNGMTGGNSCVIGGSLNKEGKMTFKSKNMLKTKEEFEEMKNIVFSNIEKAATDISNGDFPIKPYNPIRAEKNPCTYCELRSVCAKCSYALD